MAIWIQSLSWTLIYALGQGLLVYCALSLVLRLTPATSAGFRYRLSSAALTTLLVWFVETWWQQFHALTLANGLLLASPSGTATTILLLPQPVRVVGYLAGLRAHLSYLTVIFPWLSGMYIAGLALMLVRLLSGMRQLFLFRKDGISQPVASVHSQFTALKGQLNLHRPIQLLISAKAHVPMVIGVLKPVILLPAAIIAQLSTDQLETILLHELAHIKRYDFLVNILQIIVETILFFNPFVWLISSVVRRERELCCDDIVLRHTREPISYATALASLAAQHTAYATMAVAAIGQPTHLFHRIHRIMEMKKTPFSYSRMVAALLIIATIACSTAWLTPAFARPKKEKTFTATRPLHVPARDTTHNSPTVYQAKKEKPKKVEKTAPASVLAHPAAQTDQSDETKLVNQLIAAGLVDQVKGFTVEKDHDKLYIDGRQQANEVALKYLSSIKKENVRVQVYPFIERLKMHPDAGFMQVLFPVQFSSPCVDNSPKKPGC